MNTCIPAQSLYAQTHRNVGQSFRTAAGLLPGALPGEEDACDPLHEAHYRSGGVLPGARRWCVACS